jgi:uncharacterized protein (TIGR02145 family)
MMNKTKIRLLFITVPLLFMILTILPFCKDDRQIIDIDGNIYQTVKIGDQVWMAENLRVTRFRNGELIPMVTENEQWKYYPAAAYSNYNNEDSIKKRFGYLYNWYAVTDSRNIAPKGWHIPSPQEVKAMVDYIGNEEAGNKLKEAGLKNWLFPNRNSSNASGFSALPGGFRSGIDGDFHTRKSNGYWWTTTSSFNLLSWDNALHWDFADISRNHQSVSYGFSIRCIKD